MKKTIKMIALLLVVLFVATSCSSNEGVNGVVNVYNWGEYIDEDLISEFEAETGIKVVYDMFDSNESMYVKLKSGSVNYDVVFPSDYMIQKMINEDMLEKINFENVPNFKEIKEELKNPSFDPTNEYTVPYFWGTVGILYNTNMVKEEVDSLDILWNEKYKGQIFMYDSQRDSFAVALKKLGYSINSTDEEELKEAKNLLVQQKPLVQAYFGDPIRDKMIGEEGALAVVYSGDAMYCMGENENLNYAVPKEGINTWVDAMVIPKGSKNKENAEKFINFLTNANNSAKNSEYVGFSTPNDVAYGIVNDELKNNIAYWPTKEVLDKNEMFIDVGDAITIYDRMWTEVLVAN